MASKKDQGFITVDNSLIPPNSFYLFKHIKKFELKMCHAPLPKVFYQSAFT